MGDPQPKSVSNTVNFILSGTAAVMSKTASAPIERVKLLLQSQHELIKMNRLSHAYNSAFDCISRTYEYEGLASFWRGNLANCIRYFNYQALNFTLKEQIKHSFQGHRWFHVDKNESQQQQVLLTHIVIGGMAGLCSGSILYSLDYTRTRLANDVFCNQTNRQFTGIVDVYRQTLKSDGIVGLYRGFWITGVTIMVYRGLYFGLYDSMKILHPDIMRNTMNKFMVGVAISSSASVAVYPCDTVRRRMMMTSISGTTYNGYLDCISHILRREGLRSFYRGCGVNLFRGFAGAGTLVGFDLFQSLYMQYNEKNNT